MSLIDTHRHSKLQYNSRSVYLQRKLSPSLHKSNYELKQQAYLDHLNEVYLKYWNQMKHNNDRIVNLKMQRLRMKQLIDSQAQQLALSESTLLKQEFTLQVQRLSEELARLHVIRQKKDEELTKSRQIYLSSYQKQVNSSLKLQDNLQKCKAEVQFYQNILLGKQVAVKLLQSKIAANSEKIKAKMQCESKYKEILGSKLQ